MLQTAQHTALVSSTELKREYAQVIEMLRKNRLVIVVNRNSDEQADGILVPYSVEALERLEDMLEDLEMERNRKALEKEFEASLKSGKGKRTSLAQLPA